MKVHLKKLSQKDIEERKANYDVFVEVKDKKMIGGVQPKVLLTQDENGNLNMDDEMSKVKETKIPVTISDFEDLLSIAVEQGVFETEFNWKLVRERDGLTKQSKGVKWVEWNEDGRYKSDFQEPTIGRSLLMSPFNQSFTWQTTLVTEIIEQREDYIKFKTGNSTYELFKM